MNRILLCIAGVVLLSFRAAFGQTELIVNGGFEQGNTGWTMFNASAKANPTIPHSGNINLVMGNLSGTTAHPSYQTVYQQIAIPTNTVNAALSYWYNVYSTFGGNNQEFTVYIATNNNPATLAALIDDRSASSPDPAQDSAHYHRKIYTNLTQFAGQTILLVFATRMVEFGGNTFFNVDDVSLVVETTADLAPNDNFADRIAITNFSTTVSVKNLFASKEPGEPNHGGNTGGHSVWWSFTPPTNGVLTLNAYAANFSTLLGVYTGDSVTNLTRIAATNSIGTGDAISRLRFPVFTGTEYEIAVDGADGAAGVVNLQLGFQVDTNPPVVAILTPLPNQGVTNSSVNVRGTAIDNTGVAVVQYRLENADGTNDYLVATGSNVWTGMLDNLIPGTNVIRAIAYDLNGNLSASVARSFRYVLVAPLTLLTAGVGTLSPNYSNALLEIGKRYTITAKPGPGNVFSNWTGDIPTNSPVLTFAMESNLTLQANFVPTPYPAGKGIYAGLFNAADAIAYTNSGFFSASVTDKGAFTSKIQIAGKTYPLAGQFAVDGSFSNSVKRVNLPPLSVQLNIDFGGGDVITGTISDGTFVSQLTANRDTFSRTNPPPWPARKFTLIIPGSDDSSAQPGGHGYGNGMIDPLGNVIFTGTLGDGTKINQRTFLSKDNQWPFFAMPYAGKGLIMGWLAFDTNSAAGDLGGSVDWIKLPQPTKFYPAGFDLSGIDTVGSFYSFSNGVPILNWTDGVIVLQEGNLTDSITNSLTIGANNKATGANNLVFSFVPTTGLFHASVKNPATGKAVLANGAVLQKQNTGFGLFLGTNQTGQVFVGPQ